MNTPNTTEQIYLGRVDLRFVTTNDWSISWPMSENYFPKDSRHYIREELSARKSRRPHYSMRAFARDLEMSPSSLSEFLSGRMGLSKHRAFNIGQKISLSPEQTHHFWDLVESEYGRTAGLKKAARIRAQVRRRSKSCFLDVERYKLISDWHNMPVLELVTLDSIRLSHQQIADSLGVSVADVEISIERLETLGLIERHGDRFVATDAMTVTGGEGANLAIRNSHKQVLKQHAEYVHKKDVTDRESLSLSFSLDDKDWKNLNREIHDSIIKIVTKYSQGCKKPNQVLSLTLQSVKLLGKAVVESIKKDS